MFRSATAGRYLTNRLSHRLLRYTVTRRSAYSIRLRFASTATSTRTSDAEHGILNSVPKASVQRQPNASKDKPSGKEQSRRSAQNVAWLKPWSLDRKFDNKPKARDERKPKRDVQRNYELGWGLAQNLQSERKPVQITRDSTLREKFDYAAWAHLDAASDRVELGVERLGEPATIRVLPEEAFEPKGPRPGRFVAPTSRTAKATTTTETPGFEEVVDSLEGETQGIASAAEFMNNIENIREAFLKTINQFDGATQAECEKVANSLYNGFNIQQLKDYKKLTITMHPPNPDRLDELYITDRYSVSRWSGGSVSRPEGALRRLHAHQSKLEVGSYAVLSDGIDPDGMPIINRKQRLVNDILNLCWGIRPQEERLQENSVFMKIGSNWLALLLRQDVTIFQKVSEIFQVKTEISQELCLVGLTGPYDACVDAVRAITNAVNAAKTKSIDLTEISPKPWSHAKLRFIRDCLRPQFWEDIERETSTKIVLRYPELRTPGGKRNYWHTITVYYLADEVQGLVGVERRLSQLSRILEQEPEIFQLQLRSPTVDLGASLVPMTPNPDSRMIDRYQDWYRWQFAEAPADPDKEKPKVLPKRVSANTNLLKISASQLFEYIMPRHLKVDPKGETNIYASTQETGEQYWAKQTKTHIKARLAPLLHAMTAAAQPLFYRELLVGTTRSQNAILTVRKVESFTQRTLEMRRTMGNKIHRFAELQNLFKDNEAFSSNYFEIILRPVHGIIGGKAVDIKLIPELEIVVDIEEDKKQTSLREARLIIRRKRADVAMPRELVDLRLTAETTLLHNKDHVDPSIERFLERSNLNVWGTGRFETPKTLNISLPSRVLGEESVIRDLIRPKATVVNDKAAKIISRSVLRQISQERQKRSDTDKAKDAKVEETSFGTAEEVAREPAVGDSLEIPDEIEVEYSFDALAIHSKLQTSYESIPLSFSTIEAGQIGGKRDELVMTYNGTLIVPSFQGFYNKLVDFIVLAGK